MTVTLKAEKRTVTGKKVKNLRAKGLIPGNVFGKKIKSFAVELPIDDFTKTLTSAGETTLIELTVDGKKHPVLVKEVQKHPVSDQYLHVDFQEVDIHEKVSAQVPVKLIGESPAVKTGLGVLVEITHEIEVEALPTDLPDVFEISIESLTDLDSAILVKDIKVGAKVEIKTDPEIVVAKLDEIREEEVVVEAPTEEVAGEEVKPTEETPTEEAKPQE